MKTKLTHLIIASLISLSFVLTTTGISYAKYVTKRSTYRTTSASGFVQYDSSYNYFSPQLKGAVVWGPIINGLPNLEAGQKVHNAGVWLKSINNYADTIVKVRVVNSNGGGSMYAYPSLLNIPNSTSTNTITIPKGNDYKLFYIRTKSCEELGYPAGGQPPTLAFLKLQIGEQTPLLIPFMITYDCNQ